MNSVCSSRFACPTMLLLLFCGSLAAQSDLSTITGAIKDASGSAVPGAKVVVRNEATGVERQAVTTDSGIFIVTNLPSGLYTVTAEAQGFKKFKTTGNKLDANVPLAADVDATQEVQILSANYNAEYGRSGGGQVRVVTKTGGREFHGQAYEYFRNSAMDANTWARNLSPLSFQNSVPQPLRYNQFGYG